MEELKKHLTHVKEEILKLIIQHNQYVKIRNSIRDAQENGTVGAATFFSTESAALSILTWYLDWCFMALRRLHDNNSRTLSLLSFLKTIKVINKTNVQVIKYYFDKFESSKEFTKEMNQKLASELWKSQLPEGSLESQIDADIELCKEFNESVVKLYVDKFKAHSDKDQKKKLEGKQLNYGELKGWILRAKELCNRYELLLTGSSIIWPELREFNR